MPSMLQDVNKSSRPAARFSLSEPVSSSSVKGDNDLPDSRWRGPGKMGESP